MKVRSLMIFALPIAAVVFSCCRLPLAWLESQKIEDNPALVYRQYEPELQRYAERLQAGEVSSVAGRGYDIPQFLIDRGAKSVRKDGNCFVIYFGFLPTESVPELWFSPGGFDPLPPGLVSRKKDEPYFLWEPLSPHWGACHWDS